MPFNIQNLESGPRDFALETKIICAPVMKEVAPKVMKNFPAQNLVFKIEKV